MKRGGMGIEERGEGERGRERDGHAPV